MDRVHPATKVHSKYHREGAGENVLKKKKKVMSHPPGDEDLRNSIPEEILAHLYTGYQKGDTEMIISLGAGPWDAFLGGGNIPAFALAAIFSLVSAVVAISKLPTISSSTSSTSFHGLG